MGGSVIWFVDNTAALHSVIKGASSEPVMEDMVARFWLMAHALQAKVWVEYVDSGANWSDGISRSFAKDAFVIKQGFAVRELQNPLQWLQYDLSVVLAIPRAPTGLPN